MFNCNLCDKEFKSKKSLTCHKNHHNPEYHTKALKGSAALKTKKAEQTRKQNRENKKFLKWSSKNYHCVTCDTKLIYPQVKTCSEACYKIYRSKANSRIMTDKRRNSIKLGMERHNKTLPKKQYFCKICNNVLLKKSTYCSDDCKSISKKIESEKISKALKLAFVEGRHKGNEYRNRKNKSFLERSFIKYLNEYYPTVNYTFNKVTKIIDEHGKHIRNFYIDFYFPKQNLGIELDGKQHKNSKEYDQERDRLIFDAYQIKIIRISYDEFINKTKKNLVDKILKKEIE